MSFTQDPYRHMDIETDEYGNVSLECQGCGASLMGEHLSLDTPISEVRRIMDEHIQREHQRVPSDFEGWA